MRVSREPVRGKSDAWSSGQLPPVPDLFRKGARAEGTAPPYRADQSRAISIGGEGLSGTVESKGGPITASMPWSFVIVSDIFTLK